jgi:protein-L-isoaspartate(D-aspartate) O-methyltransferase
VTDLARARLAMVERQLRGRGIHDERVLAAMAEVPRELFVPPALIDRAYEDAALPIGHDQTISQPAMVATMLALLRLRGDEHALDVGTGSGYAAAVLARLCASVVSIERIPALADRARAALAAAGVENVEVVVGDGTLGGPGAEPYEAIVVAAAAPDVPEPLLARLAVGGRLVVPVGPRDHQALVVVTRDAAGLRRERGIECRFVPLVGAAGFATAWP